MAQGHTGFRASAGLSVLLFGLSVSNPAPAADVIKLTTQEWAPYQIIENGQPDGIAVKAVACIIGKLGLQHEVKILPWARAQKDVQTGVAHGFFTASKSAERDAYAELTAPVVPQVWKWYMPKDSTKDITAKDVKVAVQMGSAMQKWLDDNAYSSVQKVQSAEIMIKILQAGRIDGILSNELVFKQALKDMNILESSFKAVLHSDRPLGVYFSKAFLAQNPGFLDKFNAQIGGCQSAS